MSIDYTSIFNRQRVTKGLLPVKHKIVLLTEGIQLPCGCKVHNASLSHFTVYHTEECQSDIIPKRIGKETIGVPGVEETACVKLGDRTIALTNPYLGTFPYGV